MVGPSIVSSAFQCAAILLLDADFEQEIELGLEDAFTGTTRRLSITQNGQAKTIDVHNAGLTAAWDVTTTRTR